MPPSLPISLPINLLLGNNDLPSPLKLDLLGAYNRRREENGNGTC